MPRSQSTSACRVLVTGANGFIGRNLTVRMGELPGYQVSIFEREDDPATLNALVAEADAVVHLAGENRPRDESAFAAVNTRLTEVLCAALRREGKQTGRMIPLVLASSTQVERDNAYGRSKLAAEQAVRTLAEASGHPVIVFRLPGVFGKWCRPNYNSVVATFCHNIARGMPIRVDDPAARLRLVYVDDVVSALIAAISPAPSAGFTMGTVPDEYEITLRELAKQIEAFDNCRSTLITERVGKGLIRALYSTYLSYLPPERFAYPLPQFGDDRGVFVEMLKTPDCGQFSFFTIRPGVTRGSHYHHSKTEKFLVLKGTARMRFRHLTSGELYAITLSGEKPQVVDTIPGWVHDITNIGKGEAVVMLWANEIFDRQHPDCIPCDV